MKEKEISVEKKNQFRNNQAQKNNQNKIYRTIAAKNSTSATTTVNVEETAKEVVGDKKEVAQTDAAKKEVTKTQVTKTEVSKTEAVKEDVAKTEVGKADAALAASLFHFKELEINEVKRYLKDKNVPVRL